MTIATEKQVKIAARLYELRDRAKLLLGDAYKPRMAELIKIMEDTGRQNGKSVLDVAIAVADKPQVTPAKPQKQLTGLGIKPQFGALCLRAIAGFAPLPTACAAALRCRRRGCRGWEST